jgi:hypothetical protein
VALVLAVVRTVVLVFVVGYGGRGFFFWSLHTPRTFDEQYSICAANNSILERAMGIAIGWLLIEAAASWIAALRARRVHQRAAAAPPSPPVAKA